MFASVLSQVTTGIDRRFLMNALLPSLLFWGLIVIFLFAGHGDLATVSSVESSWSKQNTDVQLLAVSVFVGGVTFFAMGFASASDLILRLCMGEYTPNNSLLKKPFAALWGRGRAWHQAQLDARWTTINANPATAEATEAYEYVYRNYPLTNPDPKALPTHLGNIIANGATYATDRYGLDAGLLWPRLYGVFSDSFRSAVENARSSLDFMLGVATLAALFGTVSSIYLEIVGAHWLTFAICFGGSVSVCWIAYRGAIVAAYEYNEQTKAGFDLYRHALLTQMRFKLPARPGETVEQAEWEKVALFLYRSAAPDTESWAYDDSSTTTTVTHTAPATTRTTTTPANAGAATSTTTETGETTTTVTTTTGVPPPAATPGP